LRNMASSAAPAAEFMCALVDTCDCIRKFFAAPAARQVQVQARLGSASVCTGKHHHQRFHLEEQTMTKHG
jgi:hypothetical protein